MKVTPVISAGLLMLATAGVTTPGARRLRRRHAVETEPQPQPPAWRLLRTEEEIRSATERALASERERAGQIAARARRHELRLEKVARREQPPGSPAAGIRRLPSEDRSPSGPEAA